MYYSFPQIFRNKKYSFFAPLGMLISSNCSTTFIQPSKLDTLYKMWADNPYILKRRSKKDVINDEQFLITLYANILVFLCKHFYLLAYIFSFLRLNIFENAYIACDTFRKIIKGNQRNLCLPRSIFIATTSKRFNYHGAMYIGVFLPSRQMHAWVIEDGMVADIKDSIWQLYSPVSIMK